MKNKTISQKLNIILLVVIVVVLSISGFVSLQINKEKVRKQIIYKISRLEKRLQLILPVIIWNLQSDIIKNIQLFNNGDKTQLLLKKGHGFSNIKEIITNLEIDCFIQLNKNIFETILTIPSIKEKSENTIN